MTVVLAGSNFVNGATCNFGSGIKVNSCAFNSASQLSASITVAASATVGARNIVVTNPDTQSTTLTNGFTVVQGGGGSGTITLVNQVSAGNGSGSSVSSISAPAATHVTGNLLVVICRNGSDISSSAQSSPTDTAGNTFVGLTPAMNGYVGVMQMWYAKNINGNANNVVTCHFSLPDAYVTISVLQYAGADTISPLDAQANANGSSSATSGTTAALTPSKTGGMIVVGASVNNLGMTFAAGSGFTIRDASISGFSGDEDKSVTTLGAVTPAMSWNNSQRWVMVAAAFK
jgi:hypothetical protein